MDIDQLKQLALAAKARADAATPGPWHWAQAYEMGGPAHRHWALENSDTATSGMVIDASLVLLLNRRNWFSRPFDEYPNAQFIAASRADVPALADAVLQLIEERDAIEFAAHMPADYEYGLPSWINQKLYAGLISLLDRDGRVIRRGEDIEEMIRLRKENAALAAECERLRTLNHDASVALTDAIRLMPLDRIGEWQSIRTVFESHDEVKP